MHGDKNGLGSQENISSPDFGTYNDLPLKWYIRLIA